MKKCRLKSASSFLFSTLLLLGVNVFSQQTNLNQGKIITLGTAVFRVDKIESASVTPIQKVEAKSGMHFILISLKLIQIEKDAEFSSVFFTLIDKEKAKYTEPGAWGKIEVFGSVSNFEATEGATVYVRKPDDVLNLIFEIPSAIWPDQLILAYETTSNQATEK